MINCRFCGYSYREDESISACHGCPMSKNCNKLKCPNCGFEIPREPGLIKLMKRWVKRND